LVRRDRWLAFLFVALALLIVARAAHKHLGVLARNQQWGERFLAHQDPYFDTAHGVREHGPYPPSMAWMAAPLACLPTLAARVVWALLQVVALALFTRRLGRLTAELWPTLAPHAPPLFALALLLVSRFFLRDTAGGGGNLVYGYLAFAGVDAALRGRARGGVSLAASLVLKPNLAPLLLFLALRRRWRALAVTLGTGAVLFCAPGLYYGPSAYAALAVRWGHDVIDYVSLEDLHSGALVPDGLPPAEDAMNQSLREAVHRVLRPPGDSGATDVHLFEVSPGAASWVARGLEFLLAAGVAAAAFTACGRREELLTSLAFFPLALLCSPVTWKAHHVVLLPVFYFLVCEAVEPSVSPAQGSRKRAQWLPWFLFGYWFVCDLLSQEVIGDAPRDLLQTLSVVTWFDIVLLVVVLRVAFERRRPLGSDPL
jgi:hypothetical protein